MDRRVWTGGLTFLAQGEPAPRDLDVEVGLGPARQLLQDVVLADGFSDWSVDVVVPARRPFLQGHLAVLLEAEEVAMARDVLEDLVVPSQAAALEARLGPRAVELRHVEKSGVLGGAEHGGCLRPRPAARGTASVGRSRPARTVRTGRTLRQNARARAESKSSMARKRSRPKWGGA